jgi:arabinan endo-1,5-alpha-L-arabinosidase
MMNTAMSTRILGAGAFSPRWILAGVMTLSVAIAQTPPREPRVHDPSQIIQEGADHWFFCTGMGVNAYHSRDLTTWERGRPVFSEMPAWHREVVPTQKGHLWAPDVIRVGDRFYLYYSVSSFGVNTSAIGLATSPTLDPAADNYRWKDEGIVIQSRKTDDFNTIDPSVFRDEDGGRLWMAFGSFWSGIKLIELNPETGKRVSPEMPPIAIAWKNAIEAPALYKHDGWYYLFVNWGICCRGADSTYEIRVGRSRSVTGPYLDRDDVDMMKGGGTLFLATEGRMIGPGHVGIFSENGHDWLGFHYYDREAKGMPAYGMRALTWSADGWPEAGALHETNFHSVAP